GREPAAERLAVQSIRNIVHHPKTWQAMLFDLDANHSFQFANREPLNHHSERGGELLDLMLAFGFALHHAHARAVVIRTVGAEPEDPTRVGGPETPCVFFGQKRFADAAEARHTRHTRALFAADHGDFRRIEGG